MERVGIFEVRKLRATAYAVWAEAVDFARERCPSRIPEFGRQLDAALEAIDRWVEAVNNGVHPEDADYELVGVDAVAGLGHTTPSRILAALRD
jgi:hypothetical protein